MVKLAELLGGDVFEREKLRREHYDGMHARPQDTCPYCVSEHSSENGRFPQTASQKEHAPL
jgi:hypothetical protein